jgi:hypothetical protein
VLTTFANLLRPRYISNKDQTAARCGLSDSKGFGVKSFRAKASVASGVLCLPLLQLFAALCLCSCSPLARIDGPPPVHSIQEAATVHTVPLSVSRWEDYRAALQPQFSTSSAAALALALPRTSISEAKQSEMAAAGVQIGLSPVAKASGATPAGVNTSNGGSSTGAQETNTDTAENSSGTSGSKNTTKTTTTTQTTVPNETALAVPTGTVVMDPLLTYEAATAVYQEIELLNTYVKDAVQRYGYVPYVARLQVSVVPTAHLEPYDVYVDLGFFSRCMDQTDSSSVVVIPLLVTDDVETGQASSAVESARQLAASLGGITGNVALQAGLSQLKAAYNAILGTDYNSLYMATHAADNVLEIRLGAARSPNPKVKYAMLTQTHAVSFLMLVQKKYVDGIASCYAQPPVLHQNLKTNSELFATESFKSDFRDFLDGLGLTSDEFDQFSESAFAAIDASANQPRESAIAAAKEATISQAKAVLKAKNFSDTKMTTLERLITARDDAAFQDPTDPFHDLKAHWGPQVWVSAYVRMRNAVTGAELPSDPSAELESARTVMNSFVSVEETKKSNYPLELESLIDAVRRNESTTFGALFCRMEASSRGDTCTNVGDLRGGKADAAWTGLASVISMQRYSSTYLNLPKRQQPSPDLFPDDTTILLQDSCKSTSTVVLSGLAPWTVSDFTATLILDSGIRLIATSITQSSPNAPFTIQFPSLRPLADIEAVQGHEIIATTCPPESTHTSGNKTLVSKDGGSARRLIGAKLFIKQSSDDRWNGNNRPTELYWKELENVFYLSSTTDQTISLAIKAATDTITAPAGSTGTAQPSNTKLRLQLTASKDLHDVVLSFTGATLAALPSLPYTKSGEGKLPDGSALPFASIDVSPPDNVAFGAAPVTVDVSLTGVTATRTVTITATGRDINQKPVTSSTIAIPVVAAAAADAKTAPTTTK